MTIVRTVLGDLPAERLGPTLPHEHLQATFVPHDAWRPKPGDRDAARARLLPLLLDLRQAGCSAFVDCTPAAMGRDPRLLRALSEDSGLHILANTGFYQPPWLPAWAAGADADRLAAHWIREAREGLNDTDIRPGFVKIALSTRDEPVSPLQARILRAAIRVSRTCGLPIAAHTIGDRPLQDALAILQEEGLPPDRFIWVHAGTGSPEVQEAALAAGIRIELDMVAPETADRDAERILELLRSPWHRRVLASMDRGWHDPARPDQEIRPYAWFFREFLPRLARLGADEAMIRRLTVENPAEAFALRPGDGGGPESP